MGDDFVSVIFRNDEYRVSIKSHWRSLPDDEGFTLLKEKMHSFCGVHPHTIKKQDGAVIKSLDFVSPQETVFAEEAPPKYDVASQNTHETLQRVCQVLEIPLDESAGSSKSMTGIPLLSRLAHLETQFQQISSRLDETMTKVDEITKESQHKLSDFESKLLSHVDKTKYDNERIARIPVAPNLIKNSLMRKIHPTGSPSGFIKDTWRAAGKIECKAVHPFVQGFEGCYAENAPSTSVTPERCSLADKDRPVFYGANNMGPRVTRGGLSTEWKGVSIGHILKLSGTRVDQHETSITLPAVTNGTAGLVHFEAWIKCVAGAVSFNVDYPFWNKPGDFLKPQRRNGVCRAEDCRDKPQGWFRMDDVIGIGNLVVKSSSNNFLLRCFGPPETDGLGDFEVYVALPYASFVEQRDRVTISPSVCEL